MSLSKTDNSLARARDLSLGNRVSGLVGQADKVDFYEFSLSQVNDFSLSFKKLKARSSIQVKLFNGSGALLSSFKVGDKPQTLDNTLGDGTYYISVKAKGSSKKIKYQFTTGATIAEPGETPETSSSLGIFSGEYRTQDFVGTTDPIDHYKFTLAEISNFSANIDGLTASTEMRLYYDLNSNGLIDNGEYLQTGYNDTDISRTMLAGTYFLTVEPYYSSDSTQYNLYLSATPDPSNLSVDPGNGTDTAFQLTNFSTINLKDFAGAFDSVDYYKFTLSEITNFSANIDGLTASTEMRLYYDVNSNGLIDNGEYLQTGYNDTDISRTMLAGTYFLTVEPYYSSDSTRYDLFLSATPDPSNLPSDPGDRTATAYNLGAFSGTQTLRDFAGAFDSVDYYQFNLNTTGTFSANIDGVSAGTEMRLYYDVNSNGLIDNGEYLYIGYDNTDISETLQAGTYFLTVEPYYSSDSTRYNLSLNIG